MFFGHNSHCIPIVEPNDPALQIHEVKKELPIGEFVFSGQSVHAVAVPLANSYLLAAHRLHVWPFVVAIDPVLHVHEDCGMLPYVYIYIDIYI